MAKLCVGDIPIGAMNWIRTEEVPEERFGASLDTFIGKVDENGVLQETKNTTSLTLRNVKKIGDRALQYLFYGSNSITSVDFSSVEEIGAQSLYRTFVESSIKHVDLHSVKRITSNSLCYTFYRSSLTGHVDLSALVSADGHLALAGAFSSTDITSVDLSNLVEVNSAGLDSTFYSCRSLTQVDLSSLTTINSPSGNPAMQATFGSCSKLQTISFPSLISISDTGVFGPSYNLIFSRCSALTEIHFRKDIQETIEAITGYSEKFGATNATIYFDL